MVGASLVAQLVKNPPAMQEALVRFLGRGDPWRRNRLPTPIFLPENPQGQRSLAGCSLRGCKELDMTEGLSTPQNGEPIRYSSTLPLTNEEWYQKKSGA